MNYSTQNNYRHLIDEYPVVNDTDLLKAILEALFI